LLAALPAFGLLFTAEAAEMISLPSGLLQRACGRELPEFSTRLAPVMLVGTARRAVRAARLRRNLERDSHVEGEKGVKPEWRLDKA